MTKFSDRSEAKEGSTASKYEPGKKVRLITLHGTGTDDVTATGDRWWQLGSKFMTVLCRRLDLDPAHGESLLVVQVELVQAAVSILVQMNVNSKAIQASFDA